MPSDKRSANLNYYRTPPTANHWYSYNNNSGYGPALYAGSSGAGDYITAVHFPLASFANAIFTSATLKMTRFCDESSAAKVLSVCVGTINKDVATANNYATIGGSVSWSVSKDPGTKSVNVTSLMPTLMADINNRYLLIHGGTGTYTEFYAREKGESYAALLEFNYEYPTYVKADGAWHTIAERLVNAGGWHTVSHMYVKTPDGAWHTIL